MPESPNVVMYIAGFFAGLLIVGAISWVVRRFWKDSFWPPFLPAALLALIQILAIQTGYALLSILVGLVWWQIFSWRDERRRERLPPGN